jgi:transcriptional regulator with XRE-family HTH domain
MTRVRTSAEVGALARAARTARGWSQEQAADAAGVSRRFVTRLESGGHVNAELWRVLALLDAVGAELVGTVPAGSRPPAVEAAEPPGTGSATPDGFDLDNHLTRFRPEQGSS